MNVWEVSRVEYNCVCLPWSSSRRRRSRKRRRRRSRKLLIGFVIGCWWKWLKDKKHESINYGLSGFEAVYCTLGIKLHILMISFFVFHQEYFLNSQEKPCGIFFFLILYVSLWIFLQGGCKPSIAVFVMNSWNHPSAPGLGLCHPEYSQEYKKHMSGRLCIQWISDLLWVMLHWTRSRSNTHKPINVKHADRYVAYYSYGVSAHRKVL